jgi:acyl carrier protein
MTNLERLRECFRRALGGAAAERLEQLSYGAVPAWDSVTHIALVAELEAAFAVELTPEEIVAITDYAQVREALGRHGVRFDE